MFQTFNIIPHKNQNKDKKNPNKQTNALELQHCERKTICSDLNLKRRIGSKQNKNCKKRKEIEKNQKHNKSYKTILNIFEIDWERFITRKIYHANHLQCTENRKISDHRVYFLAVISRWWNWVYHWEKFNYCAIAILTWKKPHFKNILPRKKISLNINIIWQWHVIWCSHETVSALLSLTWIFKCIDWGYVKNTRYLIILYKISASLCN